MMLQNPEFLVLLLLLLLPLKSLLTGNKYGRVLAASRALIILLLVLAATAPAIIQQVQVSEEKQVDLLIDNTTSIKALENQLPAKTRKTVFIDGNSTQVFSKAARTVKENSYNILLTDGRTKESPRKLIDTAKAKNATISVFKPRERKESAISVEGPSTTVPEAENRFTVKVSSTTNETALNVSVNGEKIYGGVNDSYSFTRRFEKGTHTIQAHIQEDDVIDRNNHFYKTVKVREKPEVLSIGSQGSLEDRLSEFYSIKNKNSLPEDISQYHSVILKKPMDSQELERYVIEGNGLMYTGEFEERNYLPVEKDKQEDSDSSARVIILIDASEGSGGKCIEGSENFCIERSAEGGSAKESVKLAAGIIERLNESNVVGAVAYNRRSYLVSRPRPLATASDQLKTDISRIEPSGPSFHDRGLKGAMELAGNEDSLVMLTDGEIGSYEGERNVPQKLEDLSGDSEAKIITVGMGKQPNQPLLEDVAENSGGYYLENDETGRLGFEFGSGGGESKYKPIAVLNPNHFISRDLELDGSTTDFKPIKTRRTADTLVSASNGKEVLSAWRYGLGRVAAFTAGKENIERIARTDPELVTRTLSWTVGNHGDRKGSWTEVRDARRPDRPEARSSKDIEGLEKQRDSLYTARLDRPSLGLHRWKDNTYAYNYNPEIEEVGVDMEKLREIPRQTGGRILTVSEVENLDEHLESVDRTIQKRFSLAPFMIVLALIVFVAEVGYRKRKGRL